jgi:hypothetical protein
VPSNVDEKMLTDAVFLDVAKAFDTIRLDYLLLKIKVLNFPSYFVKTMSSYLHGPMLEALERIHLLQCAKSSLFV